MTDTDKTVFISYRRSVSSFIARAVYMDLRANGYDVFMDVETIDSGEFDRIILNQIAARAHFVLILAPGSLERCVQPGDWLRLEIEEAMNLQRNIVPLLASGFTFDVTTGVYLTGYLAGLSKFNALNVPHDYFNEAMDRLRNRFLKQPVYGTITPVPVADLPKVARKQAEMVRLPVPTEKQLSIEDYSNKIFLKYGNKYIDDTIADYSESIRLNPQDVVAHSNRGT
ncbi:MAG TPA: toll/interleukin-1 receptor domain-containing protein, partial [Phototrophicaceae bacterium]|nr:toll/interleukin-1 receptor domain-containing protein [Phototrophicaceae bacterium]